MKVQKIKIQKFKSIYDPLELDFNNITGLWKICGNVGVGKTTLGEAIIFGLFGTVGGKTNESLISWGEKHGLVELWCTSRGRNIYIKRELNKYGQSPIYVEIDGEELIFTNKRDGQSQLENEYYDVSQTTLELLCIISFNNFKSLATLNASGTKKFLDQVLGFYTLTEYADACRELRRNVCVEGEQLLSKIKSNQSQINKILEIASIARIEGNIKETQNSISALETLRETHTNEWNTKITERRKDLSEQQANLTKIKTLGTNKKKEIDFIKKGTCPTCGAPIDQSQLSIKEKEREVLVEQYKIVDARITEIQKDISAMEHTYKTEDADYRNNLLQARNLLTQLKEQEKRSKINMAEIDKINKENIELQKQEDNLQAEIAEWDELYTILSETTRTKILASFIPALNKNILFYTQQLQQPYIVEFDSSFKCSIKICGMPDEIPLSSLSTGQLKTVDMCIILGVLGTIMSNISFNITFLDELFSNMDVELRNTICQVLRTNHKPGHTLFAISHVDLESKYFDGQINVKLEFIDEVHRKSIYTIDDISKNTQDFH